MLHSDPNQKVNNVMGLIAQNLPVDAHEPTPSLGTLPCLCQSLLASKRPDADGRVLNGPVLAADACPNPDDAPDREAGDDEDLIDAFTQVLALLETLGALDDIGLNLKLAEHLTERVGYKCAGYAPRSQVSELMLLSSRISALADRLREDGVL